MIMNELKGERKWFVGNIEIEYDSIKINTVVRYEDHHSDCDVTYSSEMLVVNKKPFNDDVALVCDYKCKACGKFHESVGVVSNFICVDCREVEFDITYNDKF